MGNAGQYLFKVGCQGADGSDIPDITGKPDYIGSSPVDVLQTGIHLMVEWYILQVRLYGLARPEAVQLLPSICLQAVNTKVGMDILGVDSLKQYTVGFIPLFQSSAVVMQ